jgi:hypothetical protein
MSFYRSSHSVCECQYHVVWATKYRKRVMTQAHEREFCEQVLRRAASEYGMNIQALEVDEDHVHVTGQPDTFRRAPPGPQGRVIVYFDQGRKQPENHYLQRPPYGRFRGLPLGRIPL